MVEPWGASWGFKEDEENRDTLKNANDLFLKENPDHSNAIMVEFVDRFVYC